MEWNPTQYAQFSDHRSRPFFDLLGRIPQLDPTSIVDLGCGPGNITEVLAQRWPQAQVLGLDSSPEMVARANAVAAAENLSFALADAASWDVPEGTDLLVSSAMLQWLDGHQVHLERWLRQLAPGAVVAIQVPGNFTSPSHAVMREVAQSPRWVEKLRGVLRHGDAVADPSDYQQLFIRCGLEADVWETTYQQLLTGADPVLSWVRGTALLPVKAALSAADYLAFEDDYRAAIAEHYPSFTALDGQLLTNFPFRRIFMVGRKN
ncbi:methyltransferase domain-containing protein [Glutamicibacter endophyticus]|uniref:methyltransferase domain-containing protein n=1 Tax=Glutamicibacter endophyticus TaxID=1522174 RepID=UPI003AF1B88C